MGKSSLTDVSGLDFKPSNIRIWIHNRDIGKLQHVLWEGHGSKLRCETSNNVRVKRFLEAVPFIMVTIKDIHTAVIKNDIEGFRKKVEEPVSPIILCSKDSNGLNVLHKAAGLGYVEMAREIVDRYPAIVNSPDNDGKTPLHYAAVCRDGGVMYDLLVEYSADESKVDNRQKVASYYKNRPSDIDLTSLVMIPEAPRVSGTSYPRHWDWRIIESDQPLPRMRRTGNNADDDSAFGSAESAKLTEDAATPEIENAEDEMNGNEAEDENGGEDEEEEEEEKLEEDQPAEDQPDGDQTEEEQPDENENPEADGEENPEVEAEADDNNNEESEEKPEDEEEKQEEEGGDEDKEEEKEDEEGGEEAVTGEEADKDTGENGSDPAEEDGEDKADPSTADSGVVDTPNDEEQIVIGEHEEPTPQDNEEGEDGDLNSMALDEETAEIVENGSMEQLAALVLTGEGHRLVGRHSSNPELQAFIDNVPAYMAKIRAVHKAAREGSLKDLQMSLDRRKFAIAKDPSSPHGATPLHVAVIFGHTPVLRYLAGRFPETAHALDLDGRTPLHYAATLADNAHYYNLLLHLGANPLVQDNFGQKAQYYKLNQDDLSHKQLLRDFGAPESLADEMLVDKVPGGDTTSARRDVAEPETLATLERCFRLLTSGISGGGAGGTRRSSVPATPSANSTSTTTAGTLLGRCLRRQVFEAIKHRVTCMDHNLFDVIWPALKKYSNAYASNTSLEEGNLNVRERRLSVSLYEEDFTGNVVAPDFESYVVFSELLDPLIRDLHCVTASGDLPDQPTQRFFHADDEEAPSSAKARSEAINILEMRDLDPSGKYIMAGVIECTRNLVEHQLPLTMRIKELEDSERLITGILLGPELTNILAEGSSEDEAGNYYTLSEILDPSSEVRARLAASGLLLPVTEAEASGDERRLHGKHWPYGRGVYLASAGDLAIWVNVQDHVRVMCCSSETKPAQLGRAYVRLARFVEVLDQNLEFRRDVKLGYLTSRPCALGNTLRFELIVKLAGLSKKPEDLKHLCVVRGLRIHPTLRKDTVRLGNQQSLSIGELQTYQDFDRAVLNVLTLEKEFALHSSLKIATVIANIFKRRRLSGTRSVRP